MALSRKRLMQQDKRRLLEHIHWTEEREHWLLTKIQDISAGNLTEAKKLLEETDRKKFEKRYRQVSSALEDSMRRLEALTAAIPSAGNDDDSESSCSADSHSDSALHTHDDDSSVFSSVSATTVSSHGSMTKAHQSVSSDGPPAGGKRHQPDDRDVTEGRSQTHHPRDDGERPVANTRDFSDFDSRTSIRGDGDRVQLTDQECRAPTKSGSTGDRCPSEGRGSASHLHRNQLKGGSRDVETSQFEPAVEKDKARVPPGFRPVESVSATTDRGTQQKREDRKVLPDKEHIPTELMGNPSSKKIGLPQGFHQHDGSGDAQLQTMTPNPTQPPHELPPSTTQSGQGTPQPAPSHAVPPPLLPGSQPASQQPPVQPCPVPYHITKEKQTAVIRPQELKPRGQIEVIVSEVRSPAFFWIQLADSPLDSVSQQLNHYYSNCQSIPIPMPNIGTFCCACFTEDNCWYRARIMGVQGRTADQPPNLDRPEEVTVDVIYLDYGNREKLNLTRVRIIHPDFTKLPAQSVCCSLAKVKPPVLSGGWVKEQVNFFKTLVLGKKVQAVVTIRKDNRMPLLDISVPVVNRRAPSGDSQLVQVDVGQTMVERDMAQYVAGCGPPKAPLQPKQQQGAESKTSMVVPSAPLSVRAADDVAAGSTRYVKEQVAAKVEPNSECASESCKPVTQVGDPSAGYSASDDDRHNPFPKPGHRSDYSWRQAHQSGSQLRSSQRQSKSDDQDTDRCTASDQNVKPKESASSQTTSRGSASPPDRHGPLHATTGCSPGRAQPPGSRRKGAWSGRGSRASGARHTAPPHNPQKTDAQIPHQQTKTQGSGACHEASSGHQTPRSECALQPQPTNNVKSEQRGDTRDVEVKEQSVTQQSKTETREDKEDPSPHGDPKDAAEEVGLGRISPNSSSGISSYNSGQSDSGSKKCSGQSGKVGKDSGDGPCRRIGKRRGKDARGSGCKDNFAERSTSLPSKDLDSKPWEGKSEGDGQVMEQPANLNKPLSSSSKVLSSSSSSFFSAVAELDTIQTDCSVNSKVSMIPESAPPCEDVKTEDGEEAKSPPCRNLQLHQRDTLPTENGCVRIAMSHIVSPQEFYAHLVIPDATKLDYLAEDLNQFYNSEKADCMTEELILKPGAYCAAKFTEDGNWYRAKILQVKENVENTAERAESSEGATQERTKQAQVVELMYVDFGNKEWQAADALKPLQSLFYELPEQVIKCCLAHIFPPEKEEDTDSNAAKAEGNPSGNKATVAGWSDDTVKEFAAMTGYKTMLLGRITRDYGPESDEPLHIILLNPLSPWEICINQELVNRGLASSPRYKPVPPQDSESTASQELTKRQLLMASEGWHLKKYLEGGYDPVPEKTKENSAGDKSQKDQWDPMLSDFQSSRNSYSIDTDDPGVATVGYKAESSRKVCKFYSTGRTCYRGRQCPFDHVRQGERPHEYMDAFFSNGKIPLPPEGSLVALEVTALYSAFHFWAQLPYSARPLVELQQQGAGQQDDDGEETLELLEDALNRTYSVWKHRQVTSLLQRALGEMVCCRSPQDHRFYRAKVIGIDPKEDITQVCYVDYGDTEWISSSNVYDIQQQFLHLPHQAVECRLGGVRPLDYDPEAGASPDVEARKMFEEMVANRTLVAYVSYVDDHSKTLEVDLYDTTGKSDINIAEALIENGLVVRTDARSHPDPSGSSKGRGSIVQAGSKQGSGSEASSGSCIMIPG